MQYLVIYPPVGKQKVGNCEVIDSDNGIPSLTLKQAYLGQVKIVLFRSGAVDGEGFFEELRPTLNADGKPDFSAGGFKEFMKWKKIKVLSDKDQK